MTRRILAHSCIPEPQSGFPFDPEHLAWLNLCQQVYQSGLRLVPTSEGGLPIAWQVDGATWSTTATVEPVQCRPGRYRAELPTDPQWHARGTTGARKDGGASGAHTSVIVTGCPCEGCDALRERANRRRRKAAQ